MGQVTLLVHLITNCIHFTLSLLMGQVTLLAMILSNLCYNCTLGFGGTQLLCCCCCFLLCTNKFLRRGMQAAMKLLFIHSFNGNSSGGGSFPSNECSWINKCSGINFPTWLAVATSFCTLPELVLPLWHLLPLDREMHVDTKVILNLVVVDRSSGFKVVEVVDKYVHIHSSRKKILHINSSKKILINSSKKINSNGRFLDIIDSGWCNTIVNLVIVNGCNIYQRGQLTFITAIKIKRKIRLCCNQCIPHHLLPSRLLPLNFLAE